MRTTEQIIETMQTLRQQLEYTQAIELLKAEGTVVNITIKHQDEEVALPIDEGLEQNLTVAYTQKVAELEQKAKALFV